MHRHHPPTEDLDWALEVGVRHRPAPLLLSIFPVCAGAQRANVCEWGKWGTRGRRRFQQTLIFPHFLRFPPQCAKSGCARVAEPCSGKPQQHNQHRHQEAMAKPMQNFWRSLCCTSVKKKSLLRESCACEAALSRSQSTPPISRVRGHDTTPLASMWLSRWPR